MADVILAVGLALMVWFVMNAQAIGQGVFLLRDLALFLLSGGVSGRLYWSLAGQPESPYATGSGSAAKLHNP
ncbi:MAG: hypothetical protein K2P58_15575 [Hyphomonadaceae bacterium]|nr:hypothetical protein [Hyphomonadaceae bacterium]